MNIFKYAVIDDTGSLFRIGDRTSIFDTEEEARMNCVCSGEKVVTLYMEDSND